MKCRVCGKDTKEKGATVCKKCYKEHQGRLAISNSSKTEARVLKAWGLN